MNNSKIFYRQDNIGTTKYSISYHDGAKTHRDGSPFFDIALFKNKSKLNKFTKGLLLAGYKERG